MLQMDAKASCRVTSPAPQVTIFKTGNKRQNVQVFRVLLSELPSQGEISIYKHFTYFRLEKILRWDWDVHE